MVSFRGAISGCRNHPQYGQRECFFFGASDFGQEKWFHVVLSSEQLAKTRKTCGIRGFPRYVSTKGEGPPQIGGDPLSLKCNLKRAASNTWLPARLFPALRLLGFEFSGFPN